MDLCNFLRNLSLTVGIFLIASCASNAIFPEEVIEDKTEIVVSTDADGTTTKSERILASSDSLKTDQDNIAYEEVDGRDEVVVAEKKEVIVVEKNKDKEKMDSQEIDEWLSKNEDEDIDNKSTINLIKSKTAEAEDKTAATQDVAAVEVFEPSVVYRLETIYFANGSSVVDSSYNDKMREAAKLAKSKNAQIKVLGYASSRTRNTDIVTHKMANFKISLQRAENVAAALRRAGVPAANITIEALSDSAPAYLEVMPEGERLNRRAEIYVSY